VSEVESEEGLESEGAAADGSDGEEDGNVDGDATDDEFMFEFGDFYDPFSRQMCVAVDSDSDLFEEFGDGEMEDEDEEGDSGLDSELGAASGDEGSEAD
jgi:hypothetical protein